MIAFSNILQVIELFTYIKHIKVALNFLFFYVT